MSLRGRELDAHDERRVTLHEFGAKASEEGALRLAELAMKKGSSLLGKTLGPLATAMAPAGAGITLTEL